MGRSLLTNHCVPRTTIATKWADILLPNFVPNWKDVWHKSRSQKETAFLWSIWHKAVAVHSWRAKVTSGIDTRCNCCNLGVEETLAHCFYECPQAQVVWNYAQAILLWLTGDLIWTHTNFDISQCIFGPPSPDASPSFKRFGHFFEVHHYGQFGLPGTTRFFHTISGLLISLKLHSGAPFLTQAEQLSSKLFLVLNPIP